MALFIFENVSLAYFSLPDLWQFSWSLPKTNVCSWPFCLCNMRPISPTDPSQWWTSDNAHPSTPAHSNSKQTFFDFIGWSYFSGNRWCNITKPPEAAQSKQYLFHISWKQRIHFFSLFLESIIIFLCLGKIKVFAKNAEITNGKMASTKLILSWRILIYEQVGCVMCVMYSHPTEYYRS